MLESKPRGGMMLIILDILKDRELHGYAIAEKIEEEYGIEKPSSGLIYPILSKLKSEGLVEVCRRGDRDKKIYRITEKGIRHLEEREKDLERAKTMLIKLGEFHRLGGHELVDTIQYVVKNMDKMDAKKREKLSSIMRECTRKLRFLVDFGDIDE